MSWVRGGRRTPLISGGESALTSQGSRSQDRSGSGQAVRRERSAAADPESRVGAGEVVPCVVDGSLPPTGLSNGGSLSDHPRGLLTSPTPAVCVSVVIDGDQVLIDGVVLEHETGADLHRLAIAAVSAQYARPAGGPVEVQATDGWGNARFTVYPDGSSRGASVTAAVEASRAGVEGSGSGPLVST